MPSETPHKQQIARAFSQAAATYDAAAALQREVGSRLLAMLEARFSDGLHGKTILDIGAGSGWFGKEMQARGATVIALDLAEGMLRHTARHRRAACCLLADAERLPLADNSVDACFSSLAVQWCDLSAAAAEMRRVTRNGGTVAAATVGEGSLHQLGGAWRAADSDAHTNPFLGEAEIRRAFGCFAHTQTETRTHTQTFADLQDLLGSLKNIGANHVGNRENKGLTGKRRWQRFCAAYETLRRPDGLLPLDYRIAYILAGD